MRMKNNSPGSVQIQINLSLDPDCSQGLTSVELARWQEVSLGMSKESIANQNPSDNESNLGWSDDPTRSQRSWSLVERQGVKFHETKNNIKANTHVVVDEEQRLPGEPMVTTRSEIEEKQQESGANIHHVDSAT